MASQRALAAAAVEAPVRQRPKRRPSEGSPKARPREAEPKARTKTVSPARRPAAKPSPRTTPKPRTAAHAKPRAVAKQRVRSRAGIAWIIVGGVLLAGVVFVNLAVLRLNLSLDSATQQRAKLRAENAALIAKLSAASTSGKIQSLARSKDGLEESSSQTYIDLAPRKR